MAINFGRQEEEFSIKITQLVKPGNLKRTFWSPPVDEELFKKSLVLREEGCEFVVEIIPGNRVLVSVDEGEADLATEITNNNEDIFFALERAINRAYTILKEE